MQLTVPTHKALLAVAFAAATFAGAAQADDLSVDNFYTSSTGVQFTDNYSDSAPGGLSGAMALWNVQNSTTGKSFLAYCLEPAEAAVQALQSYTASAYANTSVQELYDRFYGSVTANPDSADRAMGFQLALWELHGGYAVSSWELPLGAAIAEATSMLSVVNGAGTVAQKYNLTAWTNNGHQDVLQAAPVPEPESYALMVAGLVLVGSIARRRSKVRG